MALGCARPRRAATATEENVYFAEPAKQTERYDEMADYMRLVDKRGDELSAEGRNLLSVTCKDAACRRHAAGCIITSREQKEGSKSEGEERVNRVTRAIHYPKGPRRTTPSSWRSGGCRTS